MMQIGDPPGRRPVVCLSTVTIVVAILLLAGCRRTGGATKVNMNSSVTELLGKLPNLQPYGIESCSYAIEKSSANSRVPSPSDVRVELKGSAKLSESGFEAMKSEFTWAAITRDKLPEGLADIAPAGDLLYSQKLNETFAGNPTFAHGFVVVPNSKDARTLYFLSTDRDHLIRY